MIRHEMRTGIHKLQRAGCAVALSLLLASPAAAREPASAFEMAVLQDAAFGPEIVSGEFDLAIANILAAPAKKHDLFPQKNNLCVALTMKAQFDKAKQECDAAIAISERRVMIEKDRSFSGNTREHAMALSNRGVLKLMLGETKSAKADFEAARSMRAGLSSPKRNLQYLAAKNEADD